MNIVGSVGRLFGGEPDCRPLSLFRQATPELNSAVLRHTDNERFVGKNEAACYLI
jgi:hypothetical protein